MSDVSERMLDNCDFCRGTKGGMLGNENNYAGIVVCDYCSVDLDIIIADVRRITSEELGEQATAIRNLGNLVLAANERASRYETMTEDCFEYFFQGGSDDS